MLTTRRLIVMRPGALGDALLALPALAAMRAAWPDAHLTVIARADVLPLIEANKLADTSYPYDLPSWATLWSDAPQPDALLTQTFAGADALVAWVRDADGTLRRTATALGVAHVIVAPGRPPAGAREHAATYLLRTLAPLGLPLKSAGTTVCAPTRQTALPASMAPLHPPPVAREAAARRWHALGLAGQRVVALHPGSGGDQKRWPPDRFAALAAALHTHGAAPLVIEGPADGLAVAALRDALAPGLAPALLRDAAVDELAALLARCAAYVGNDSGVTHLSALLGVPTLALFGPTDPAVWSPLGPRVHLLRADDACLAPMRALPVERVQAELVRLFQAPPA